MDENLIDKIDNYLLGRMSEVDRTEFEERMSADSSVAAQVERQRLHLAGFELLAREKMRNSLKEISERPTPNHGVDSSGRKWLWLLIALLLAGGIILLFKTKSRIQPVQNTTPTEKPGEPETRSKDYAAKAPPTPPAEVDVYAKESPAEPYSSEPKHDYRLIALADVYTFPSHLQTQLKTSTDANLESSDDPILLGAAAFSDNKFTQAIQIFSEVKPTPDPEVYALAQEWLGHTYLSNNQPQKAAPIFKKMIETSRYGKSKQRAEWYYLVCLLPDANVHKKEIDMLLDTILSEDLEHYYNAPAANVAKRLGYSKQ